MSHVLCLVCCLQRALGISFAQELDLDAHGLIRSRFRLLLSEAMPRAERAPFPLPGAGPGAV